MDAVSFITIASAAVQTYISVGDSLLIALIGLAVVLAVLVVLMFIISLTGKIITKFPTFRADHPKAAQFFDKAKSALKRKPVLADIPAPAVQVQPITELLAAGSCGELKLIHTDEREAAMIMAIVADSTGIPLNELRFLSIKKIDGEEKQ